MAVDKRHRLCTLAKQTWDDRRGLWLALGTAAIAFVVYLATLAPGLTFEHHGTDGGDLIAAAWTRGVPHPTGYPTYTLLAWLFSHLPIGIIAYRVNLLSALCAAGTVGLLGWSAHRLLPPEEQPAMLPALTALMLAFSSLFWSQAVISEVYALLALFAALLFWLLVRWRNGSRRSASSDLTLWLAAFVLGLGLGNHVTLVFAVPAALILLWSDRKRWFRVQTLLPAIALFLVGLSVYVYLPLAASHRPPVNWGNPQTWKQFLWVVTAEQYQGFAFGLESAAIPGRISAWAALIGDQFGWWGVAIILIGIWWWWRRDRSFVLASSAWMLLVGTYAFFYNTGDSHVYLLPAMLLLALWWSGGTCYLLHTIRHLRPVWRRLALLAILLLPMASLALHWQAADLSDDWYAHAYIYQTLEDVAPNGLVVVRGDRPTFALWYAIYAEGQRQDVAVVSGPLLAFIWYRKQVRYLYPDLIVNEPTADGVTIDDLVQELIAHNLPGRTVYATDPKDEWEAWFDFVQEEKSTLYRVYPRTNESD